MRSARTAAATDMKRIQFAVRYPDAHKHPLHRRLMADDSPSRAELRVWSPTPDATTLFWFDGDKAAAQRTVTAIDSLETVRFVAGVEETYAFLQQSAYEFPDELLALVAAAEVAFLPPVVFLDSGEVRFEAVGDGDALSAFHDGLSELGDLSIERVRSFEWGSSPVRLTDRQQEALSAAKSVGYYEVPREGTIEDVAAALDCAPSTAGELVRKAEAAVIDEHLRAQR